MRESGNQKETYIKFNFRKFWKSYLHLINHENYFDEMIIL